MTKLNEKINKLVKKLVNMAIMMGYSVQATDHIELNKEEVYQLIHEQHVPEIQVIKRFVQ